MKSLNQDGNAGESRSGAGQAWSRRRLLGGLGAAAGMAAASFIPLTQISVAGEEHPQGHTAAKSTKRQWGFVIDLRRCDGCKKCTEACQKEHFLPTSKKDDRENHEWIKV